MTKTQNRTHPHETVFCVLPQIMFTAEQRFMPHYKTCALDPGVTFD